MVGDLYHRIYIKYFGYRSPNKDAKAPCWNIVTTPLVCLFNELHVVRVVADDALKNPDIENELYLWGVL